VPEGADCPACSGQPRPAPKTRSSALCRATGTNRATTRRDSTRANEHSANRDPIPFPSLFFAIKLQSVKQQAMALRAHEAFENVPIRSSPATDGVRAEVVVCLLSCVRGGSGKIALLLLSHGSAESPSLPYNRRCCAFWDCSRRSVSKAALARVTT